MKIEHDPPLILVADDQIPTTVMLERVFTYEGYQVQCVYDGISAVEKATSLLPDLILLDINMPGMDGFDVLLNLRDNPNTNRIPTILITAMGELSGVVRGLSLGADDYLKKPFHPQELLARAQSKMKARKLEDALQRRTEELEALLQVSNELSQHLQIDELLDVIVQLVINLLPSKVTVTYYLDSDNKLIAHRIKTQPERELSIDNQLIIEYMLRQTHSIRWPDAQPLIPKHEHGICSFMKHGNNVRGLLVIANDSPYDDNHIRLLEGVSRNAALALHNAELYDIQANYALHLSDMVDERTSELESAQQMLVRSEKLASVGRLAASVAHEINNPLLPIQINLEGMLECVSDGDDVDVEDIERTLESVERIKAIVNQLLGFTGSQQIADNQFQLANIIDVIDDIIKLNHKFFQQEGVTVDIDDLNSVPPIFGNKYQLEQIFMNMALNAKDAMGNGGTLKLSSQVENNNVVVKIRDTGSGIPDDLIETIFEPFVSTKENGNGLGLFISYGIIEKHNGVVFVESEVGHGTCFTIRFPVASEQV